MTLTIDLIEECEKRLRDEATDRGLDSQSLARELVQEALSLRTASSELTRFREAVRASVEPESETVAFLQDVVDAARASKSATAP